MSLSPHLQIELTWIEASYWNLGMRMRVLPMAILEGALLLFLREVLHQFLRSQHEVEVLVSQADYQREQQKQEIEKASGMDIFDLHAFEAGLLAHIALDFLTFAYPRVAR